MPFPRSPGLAFAALLLFPGLALAFAPRSPGGRLEDRVLPDPVAAVDAAPRALEDLPVMHPLRLGWTHLAAEKGVSLHVVLDDRSGAPLSVVPGGLDWPVAPPQGWKASEETLRGFEESVRAFLKEHRSLLLAADGEVVFDRAASGPVGPHGWRAVLTRQVGGVPVEGDTYLFTFGYGRLVLFGASRWTTVDVDTKPTLPASLAGPTLLASRGLSPREASLQGEPELRIVPERRGEGYGSALVWRLTLAVEGDPGTWVGLVDAHDGRVRAFYDDARYAQVKGGVHPESADGACPSGCEQPGFPMPYASLTVNGAPTSSNAMGVFPCTPGATATTQLLSPTVRISDACGPVSESALCGSDLDLGVNAGTNCTIPAGHSAGDTKAARTAFYTVNRLKEHARSWLPANPWLTSVQTLVNTNVNLTCNALWSGGVLNLYREGGGCRNTGELAGVIQHEWGHGLDQNDGSVNFTSPSEAYADVTELLADHTSCIGRGFLPGNCAGYGNPCLSCTGIRDMDWNARAAHTPWTLATIDSLCGGGGTVGPCGGSAHCESYVVGETIWDLAVRDLPAVPLSLDAASAWQLVDRLWYWTRNGAQGNMYQCAPPFGGCMAGALYLQMLAADDDNGNLTDGTVHMTAIYAAFNRHGIACATPSPANSAGSAVVTGLTLSGVGGAGAVDLSWTGTPAPGAASYRVLRSDLGCSSSFTTVATVPGTAMTYTDTGLPTGFPLSYRVQAIGANAAHESRVSNCVTASATSTPRPVPQLTASRADATTITLSWDVATCTSLSYELVYGSLAGVAGYAVSGAFCSLGTSGTTSWSAVPAGNLWFLVTGTNGSGTEASWGDASSGPRNGSTPSGQCGNTARSNAASCP